MGKIPFKKISPQGKQYTVQLSNAFIVILAFKRIYCYLSFLTSISQMIKRGIWLPVKNFSIFEFEVTCDYAGWTKHCITFETILSLVIVAQFQSQID